MYDKIHYNKKKKKRKEKFKKRKKNFFNDTATTEIYTLSLHDALPISHLLPRPLSLGFPIAPGPSTCLMHPTWAGEIGRAHV